MLLIIALLFALLTESHELANKSRIELFGNSHNS